MKTKKLFTILFFVAVMVGGKVEGQITLDTTVTPMAYIGYDFKTVQISPSETKYFWADTVSNTFNLYNMDWTPFIINVHVPIPFNGIPSSHYQIYQCLYITRALFDCDSTNIEYLYTAPSGGGGNRKLYVMRIDGTQLLELDSAFCEYCFGGCLGGSDWVKPIVNTSSGAKMFVLNPYYSYVRIYSLCGSYPEDVFDFQQQQQQQSLVKVFPNPSSGTLSFEINLPDNMNEYELVVVDGNANEVKREKVSAWNRNLTMDVRDMSGGTYFYTLCTKNKSYQSGKFVLNK